jgi:protein-tyrosine phosphatase
MTAAKTFGIAPEEVDMTNIKAFYILQGNYIDGALNKINGDYGGMENYLVNELELTELEIEQLKQVLLH